MILFIDELHTLVGAGGAEGAIDASNVLKPALARGEIQCIGATTLDEYRKYIEKDSALDRRFQVVMVEPSSKEETIDILKGLRRRMESRTDPKEIVLQGIWSDGSVREKKMPGSMSCSTGVAIMFLQELTKMKADESDGSKLTESWAPRFVRVFHDGLLVREWDQKNQRYNLELD